MNTKIGPGYDLFTSQFSPDGRIFQVEYAQKAVENSGACIGLRGKDGIVFAVEKLVTNKLYELGASKRIFSVDTHIGFAIAGLSADARRLVEIARAEAASYRTNFNHAIPLHYLKSRMAMYMHQYTLFSAIRPFGCSIVMGTYEYDGPEMYCIDPSGTSYGYYGCAIGKSKQLANTEIEKLPLKDMSCQQLINEAARIIYVVHGDVKDKAFELELSWVGELTNRKHELVPQKVFEEAEAFAKKSVEENDSEEESA